MRTLEICFILFCFSIIFAADINIDTLKIIDLDDDIIDFEVFELDSEIIYTCKTETELYILSSDDTLSMPLTENYTLLQCHDDSILAVVEDSAFINYAHIYKVYPEIDFVSTVELPDTDIVSTDYDSLYHFYSWAPVYDTDDNRLMFFCDYKVITWIGMYGHYRQDNVSFLYDFDSDSILMNLDASCIKNYKNNKYLYLSQTEKNYFESSTSEFTDHISVVLIDSTCSEIQESSDSRVGYTYGFNVYCFEYEYYRHYNCSFYANPAKTRFDDFSSYISYNHYTETNYSYDIEWCNLLFTTSSTINTITSTLDSVDVSSSRPIEFITAGHFINPLTTQYIFHNGFEYVISNGEVENNIVDCPTIRNEDTYVFDYNHDGYDELFLTSSGKVFALNFGQIAKLSPGWNMFSMVGDEEYYLVDDIIPSCESVYEFDGETQVYELTDTLVPGKGYFILMTDERKLRVVSSLLIDYDSILYPGWNLIGSVDHVFNLEALHEYHGIITGYFGYDNETSSYVSSEWLYPFNAVWILSTENCLIHIGE